MREKMKIGFCLFEAWHGKRDIGSSRIRGHWLIKNWPGAESFVQGQKYDAVIFQKTYWPQYANEYDGVKILDLCDADWLDSQPIKEMIDAVDAITCSTDALTDYIKQLTDKPVLTIPDRQDLEFHNKQKVHSGMAKKVCWFGYSHNASVLDISISTIKKHKVRLTVISDLRPPYSKADKNVKWDLKTINKEILKCDFVLMPKTDKGRFIYKSNNKITKAWALGMPVATNPDEFKKFMYADIRKKEAEKRLKEVKEKWDVRQSVREYQNLIQKIKDERQKKA